MAYSLGQTAGSAMDLTTVDEDGMPWDFSVTSNQKKAMKRWEEERPWLLVVSPPCTMFSTLQNLTLEKRDADEVRKQLKEAVKHLTFAVYMCLKQAAEGRKFMFEHPVAASSWQLALVNQLLFLDSAERVNFDFCALGMTIKENGMPTPVRKRTSVVTNSKRLSQALKRKQCTGDYIITCQHNGRQDQTVPGVSTCLL